MCLLSLPGTTKYDTISLEQRQVSVNGGQSKDMCLYGKDKRDNMSEKYYVLTEHAVPEVLLKVMNAKTLLDSGRVSSINEAAESAGISRSSFYKYKDDIFEFHEEGKGRIINLSFQMKDEPGLLSEVLHIIADTKANILTIHQSIPINGSASLSLSIEVLETTGDIPKMVSRLEQHDGVKHVKLKAQE